MSTKPAAAIQAARKRIANAKFMLQSLSNTRAEQQARLESALLNGRPSAAARRELDTISELETDQNRDISDANSDIDRINQATDQARADQLLAADQEAILALCKPLDDFLKANP